MIRRASFYLDHNVSGYLPDELRALGHDVTTALAQGLKRGRDAQHLLLASTSGWTLVTHDHDFIVLQEAWIEWSTAWGVTPRHHGILLLPTTIPVVRMTRYINALLKNHPALESHLYELHLTGSWTRH